MICCSQSISFDESVQVMLQFFVRKVYRHIHFECHKVVSLGDMALLRTMCYV